MRETPGRKAARVYVEQKIRNPFKPGFSPTVEFPRHKPGKDKRLYRRDHQGRFRDASQF